MPSFLRSVTILILINFMISQNSLSQTIVSDITSYNRQTVDKNAIIHLPKSIEEAQQIIKDANRRGIKLRVTGSAHSTSSLILSADSEYISTRFLTGILEIDQTPGRQTVKVGGGTLQGELWDDLAGHGYSLGFAFPAYRGLTIAGLLATGSHGSSRLHKAISSQRLVSMTLIDGEGNVRTINKDNLNQFRAAQVNLGLMGLVADVTLEIEPDFNLRFKYERIQNFLGRDGQVNFGPVADSEIVMWSPALNLAVKYSGNKTSEPPHPDAMSTLLGDNKESAFANWLSARVLRLGQIFPKVNGAIEKMRINNSFDKPFINPENDTTSYVGRSSQLLLSKFFNPSLAFTHTEVEFAFPISEAEAVLSTARSVALREKIHFPISNGFFMRFAKSVGSDAGPLLSHIERPGAPSEVWVIVSIVDFRANNQKPHGQWTKARDLMVKELMAKHQLLWHWGKNSDRIFEQFNPVKNHGSNMALFKHEVVNADPRGTFSNSFTASLGIDGSTNVKSCKITVEN